MREIDFIRGFLKENIEYVQKKYTDKAAVTVSAKAHASDLLTEVDLTIQKRFVDKVKKRFPDDAIVGEEGEFSRFPNDPKARAWIIDPIDGTYNFIRGLHPIFGISIAFAHKGENVAGGVVLPITGEFFLAERGAGSFCNGKRLRVSNVKQLNAARIDIDFSDLNDRKLMLQRGLDVFRNVGQLRCYGSAVASICQIATGDTEGYLHMNLAPWDFAASQLIVEEAGGRSSRLNGSPLRLFDAKQGILITNGVLHREMLAMIKS
ncbi:MAG TPA: inositol monophosphatase [Candidatus Hydrogenedentes bacterium]|nr:inositol monophosphatase [Candidatus Hydrogenedentota bacterium]